VLARLGAGTLLLLAVVVAQPRWASAGSTSDSKSPDGLLPSGAAVCELTDEQLGEVRGGAQPPSVEAERRKSVVLWDEASAIDAPGPALGVGNAVSVSGSGLRPGQIRR
jgi:hypothetical protein